MDYLIPTSLAYESIKDLRSGPKLFLGAVVTTSGTVFYYLGYNSFEIVIYSVLFYEFLLRFGFLLLIVHYLYESYKNPVRLADMHNE